MAESLGMRRGGAALRRLGLRVLDRLKAGLGAGLRAHTPLSRRRLARPEAMSEHMLRDLGLSEMVRGACQAGEADFGHRVRSDVHGHSFGRYGL